MRISWWAGLAMLSLTLTVPGISGAQDRERQDDRRYRYEASDEAHEEAEFEARGRRQASRDSDRERTQDPHRYTYQDDGSRDDASHDASSRGQSKQQRSRNQFPANAQSFIEENDHDGDGRLSRNELPQAMRDQFQQLDRNRDKQLSASELQQHATRMKQSRPGAVAIVPVEVTYVWVADASQGKLRLEDLQQAYQVLQEIDDNQDHKITRDELNAKRKEMVGKWAKTAFQRCDQDGDGALTQDEIDHRMLLANFEQIDQNSDDEVSLAEFRQAIEKRSGFDQEGQTVRGQDESEPDEERATQRRVNRNRSRRGEDRRE